MSEQVDLKTIPVSPDGGNQPSTDGALESDKDITVFHDKENFNVKHPLANKWTLWFTKPASGKVRCRVADCWLNIVLTPLLG
jgi:translation initiation factor 4E